ncbi:amidohydrolase family protein [Parahaliea mediterranea]|uniref:amidohydrolase family protein n=1 Tax=Parahaliea mediterranea TaxID=651086 RepID=UPI000E2F122F|nr:amidohydrolase family protein [Parahaliea mediterranea]
MKSVRTLWFAMLMPLLASPVALAELRAVVGGNVVDISSGDILKDAVVLVEDERITAIGRRGEVNVPEGADRVDASGTWLIPGLMNMHVHLGLILPGKMEAELANESSGALALRMMANAQGALEAGVTTIRMPGEHARGDMAVKAAIEHGDYVGPRIFSAGEYLAITGGHGSAPGETFADGPYELIKKARREISRGASWVKILISGGIATDGGGIAEPLMTPEEINAVVDAAHRFGAKVAAHSGSSIATDVAVDAGVDSIEHGYFLDRDILRKMKKQGTWLVPTIVVSQPASEPFFTRIGSPDWYLERRNSTGEEHWKMLQTAINEGVNIALGTDQLPQEPNDGTTATAREAQYYVEAGMSHMEALQAATIQPARMLGADADIGSLEVGKYADIVALSSDPTRDIKALRDIRMVMKGGEVYRNELAR